MTTPQKKGDGIVLNSAYLNPLYVNEELDDDVMINDADVTVTNNGVSQSKRRMHDDESSFRETSYSVNYDDVVQAEEEANEVTEKTGGKLQPPTHVNNLRRHSGLVRRKASKDDEQEAVDECYRRELILKIRKTLPLKNFKDEIRAQRDLEKFLISPVVLLDCTHTSLDLIVESLIAKLQKDLEPDEKIKPEAGKNFFTFNDQYQDSLSSVDHLRETIQGVRYKPEGADYEETWVTALCSLPMLKRSHVGIARLRNPLNLGNKSEEVTFVIAVIAPQKEKFTKNAVEIGRTFSSMMLNSSFRYKLTEADTEDAFKEVLIQQCNKYKKQRHDSMHEDGDMFREDEDDLEDYSFLQFGRGVYDDIKRRLPHYWSDYKDGFVGKNTIHKLVATVFFLYFACLLPDIAFGTLYEKNTNGTIGVTSCIVSQTIGGMLFAIFSGQPMLILLTTAPLALYVKVIMMVSNTFSLDFRAMYTMTGIWNSIFLALQAFFNFSKLMKYSTRSTEEIFGFFIALAFTADAIKATVYNFDKNYHFESSDLATAMGVSNTTSFPNATSFLNTTSFPNATSFSNATSFLNATSSSNVTSLINATLGGSSKALPNGCVSESYCYRPENSVLFLFLMLGTLWLGLTLLKFDESQFLSATKREILADYALPIAVVALSFCGSYLFRAISLERFKFATDKDLFTVPDVGSLPALAHLGAMGLGLCLSCLFFVDQNVSAALVNTPQNKLKKGPAYHWDLLVVGLVNLILSVFTLPWVHAALPHSPLHVKALADVEQHVSNVGTVHDEIVKVRETRMTAILSHVLIGLSLLIVHVLQYIPVPVLQGLFLYLGLSSFIGNQMFDRMMLIFTEGSSYPPNHYVRKVPQRKLHLFTFCQMIQLIIVAVFGFADLFYLKMIFPLIILLLLPIRHKLLPMIIERKYLSVLDS